MGRKPTVNLSLPPHLRARRMKSGTVYYYYDTGQRPRKEIPLGADRLAAIKRWADLEGTMAAPTLFPEAVAEYVKKELPGKAAKTQTEYRASIKRLLQFFGGQDPAPLDEIAPNHIYAYGERHAAHPVQAGRDKATMSAIFEFARRKGYTRAVNPCAGVKFKGSKSQRTVYVSDAVLRAVYEAGDDSLRDAMDLAYLTGQRPQDVLGMSETDIKDGALYVRQRKTQAPLRVRIVGRLEQVIERCQERKKAGKVWTLSLLTNERGRTLTKAMLRKRFDVARLAAIVANPRTANEIKEFQFRDLRAKAGTDKSEAQGTVAAQRLLGHAKATTTDIYIRSRGVKVEPNK